MSGMRSLNSQRWLDAYTEPNASLYTFAQCITLADLNADGDYKLIIADLGTGNSNLKLKVYRGTSLMSESTLLDVPTAVVSFYMDSNEPRIPAIACMSGPNIYVYKNMRPYFKFSLPSLDVNSLELDLWAHVNDGTMEVNVLYEMLQNLRDEIGFANLTSQSQMFLIGDFTKHDEFVEKHKGATIKRQAVITCATTLNKNMADFNAVSVLVVATENGDIFFLDPQAFTILETVSIGPGKSSNAPSHIIASGLYDVDYRVLTACRDGSINLLRRGYQHAKQLARLTTQCVAMVMSGGGIVAATMEHTLQCYSKGGKKQWVTQLPGAVTALTTLPLPHLGLTLLVVALKDGAVHFYNGRDLVDVITASDTVSAILFGQYGQEEHSLVMVTVGGCLMVKILKRTAVFTSQPSSAQSSSSQASLAVPRKTKLFVEQTLRERENCADMHRAFQRDLFRLRLNTARACAQAMQSCSNPISTDTREPLKMSAQVLGLGPTFKLHVTLENMSTSDASIDLAIAIHCDDKAYAVEKPYIPVPMLVPGLTYHFETFVECVSEMGVSDEIRIFIVKPSLTQPLLAALINMPICDMLTS